MLKSEMKQPTYRANKELRSVRVGPRVGHAQNSLALVRQFKVFVVEFGSVNGFSSRAIVVCEVPLFICGSSVRMLSVASWPTKRHSCTYTLTHELGNNAMEAGSLVTKPLFASAKSTKVFGSLQYSRERM